jgi:predicted nucleic acid-binding protein
MKVLIDTNVALDVLLVRYPFHEESAKILLMSEKKIIEGYVSAAAITDIYYITRKSLNDRHKAIDLIRRLLSVVNIAAVDGNAVYKALDLEWNDFEDSVQYAIGESLFADYIVSRNPKDFVDAVIPILTPHEFIDVLSGVQV